MARKKLCKRAKKRKRVRVGTKYQANIPTGVKEDGRSDLFRFGRPIPVTWVCRDMRTINENPIESNSSIDLETRSNNVSSEVGGEEEMNLECKDEGLLPVHNSFCKSWSSLEHHTFLLGLYLFGENFGIVKEFMGKISNLGMGSLLSYFDKMVHINSQDYARWSKWTSDRQRTLDAKKIFTGLEHHELLFRLVSNLTQERRDSLLKLADNYLGERLSLKDFVFNLSDIVGMNQLVEAVAIGQEDRDLFEFPPTCSYYVVIQELPAANRFSSVTNQTIIDILNEDVRSSKEKTRHIFCDLVWPRLVSKGWCRCQNSKHMVFFVPGIVDFSSDELEKGIHYFDSMTDVLSMVASKPHLLESESDIEIDRVTNQDLVNEEQHDYIQTDGPQSNHDLNMTELTSSLVSKAANDTEQGPEEPLNLDMNQYSDNEERNGYIQPNVENDLDLERVTTLDTSLDRDVDESITNKLYDGIQEQTPPGKEKYDEFTKEQCLKMVAVPDSGDSSFTQELKTNQPDFSNAGAKMVHQRFSMRDRTATTKVLEAFSYGYLGPKKKRKDGEKIPSRQVQDLERVTTLDTSLDRDVDESITNKLYDGIQEQTPLGNGKYDDAIEEHCLKMVEVPENGDSSFSQELKTNQPDFSNAGAKMVHQRFSMRDRTATTKVLEAFSYGYLGPKKKQKSGEKIPSWQVQGKIVPVASGCSGGAEKVAEDSSQ